MAAALLAASGCAVSGTFVRPGADGAAPVAADSIDTRVILIGDAGLPRLQGGEPVLAALESWAGRIPDRTWIVFLGDNIYPDGLPPADDAARPLAEQRLRAQFEAGIRSGAEVVFVPGNHDYAGGGWEGMQRERAYLEAVANPRLRALPSDGCPGPEVVDAGRRARLVFLDSQWWFQGPGTPQDPSSSCPHDAPREIQDGLAAAIESAAGRQVIVMAHHPLASHGGHGGFFTWRQHLFPLTEAASWAWVPLPIVGSLYPLARQHGITEQDLSDATYRRYRDSIAAVLQAHPVLAFAAGHEHTLQILQMAGTQAEIVSGAGSVERPEHVGRGSETILATSSPGFAVLDLLQNGRARLEMIEVDGDSGAKSAGSFWLQ